MTSKLKHDLKYEQDKELIVAQRNIRENFITNFSCRARKLSQKHYLRMVELNNTKQLLFKRKDSVNDKLNVIFGLAYGYGRKNLFIFLESLRKCQYKGEIILFINEKNRKNSVLYLLKRNVTILLMTDKWPYYSKNNFKYPLKRETILEKIPKKEFIGYHRFAIYRHFLVNAFLSEYGSKNKHYLFTDVRDVYFQLHPFSFNIPRGVIVNEEPRTHVVKECRGNYQYVSKFYPPTNKIFDNYIYNDGVIYFTYPEMVGIFESIRDLVVNNSNKEVMDQGAYIVTLVNEPKEYYYFMTDGFGPVRNIGQELNSIVGELKKPYRIEDIFKIQGNKLINYDCSIPVLIHMYTQYRNNDFRDFIIRNIKNK